ncbi:hypothetical protein [Roseibium sp.]|uniref:hypothetical protein n=1 Tax=Roseibium sp. TaxID=1936156 RepID=UPI003BAC7849
MKLQADGHLVMDPKTRPKWFEVARQGAEGSIDGDTAPLPDVHGWRHGFGNTLDGRVRRAGTVEISFLAIKRGTYHFGVPGSDLQKLEITIK